MTPPNTDSPQTPEILLVEDSDEDAELTLRALTKCRLANLVLRVCDGEEALDVLFGRGKHAERISTSPRVVLLDLKLPKMGGLQVLRGSPRIARST
jgi:two-component system, response regulator